MCACFALRAKKNKVVQTVGSPRCKSKAQQAAMRWWHGTLLWALVMQVSPNAGERPVGKLVQVRRECLHLLSIRVHLRQQLWLVCLGRAHWPR